VSGVRTGLATLWVLVATAALAAEPVDKMLVRLRAVESAQLRGEVEVVRLALQAEAQRRPGDPLLKVALAWCALPSDEAWNALRSLSKLHDDEPWPRQGMGRIYAQWGMLEQARAEYEAALRLDPRFYPALTGLGQLALAAADWDGAQTRFGAALAIREDAEALAGLGLAQVEAGAREEGRANLERAVALWPDQPRALAELIGQDLEAERYAEAAGWAMRQVALFPKDPKARRTLAELKDRGGEITAAAEEYERAAALGQADASLYRRLGQLYAQLEDGQGEGRAVAELARLERSEPAHPLRLSELAQARGDHPAAEEYLKEAILRGEGRAELHLHLGRFLSSQDRPREALDAFRTAQALGDASPELAAELKAGAERFRLPKVPLRGGIDAVYAKVASSLHTFFLSRHKQRPSVGGALKVRVRVSAEGRATATEIVEDGLGDPLLVGHAYFALKDAHYPKQQRDPVFEFELRPPKRK
jgi:Tfp pilus assembly protein PilF